MVAVLAKEEVMLDRWLSLHIFCEKRHICHGNLDQAAGGGRWGGRLVVTRAASATAAGTISSTVSVAV